MMQNDYEAPIKSVGHGITCSCDLRDNESVWRVMLELSQDIGHRLRVYGLAAMGVRLAVRSNDLSGSQYQTQLSYPQPESDGDRSGGKDAVFDALFLEHAGQVAHGDRDQPCPQRSADAAGHVWRRAAARAPPEAGGLR